MADDNKGQPKPTSPPPPPPADPKATAEVRTKHFSDGYDDRTNQRGKKDGR